MREFGNCETIMDQPLIVLEENKSRITFINNGCKKIKRIRIDGCVIKQGLRCDYLIIDSFDTEHYIELKGSDIKHAVKQIEETLTLISNDKYRLEKFAFIISTRCPLLNATIQNFKSNFKKNYNALLIIKNSPFRFSLK